MSKFEDIFEDLGESINALLVTKLKRVVRVIKNRELIISAFIRISKRGDEELVAMICRESGLSENIVRKVIAECKVAQS